MASVGAGVSGAFRAGAARLREALYFVPSYNSKAMRAKARGDEMAYWRNLFGSQVMLVRPPKVVLRTSLGRLR